MAAATPEGSAVGGSTSAGAEPSLVFNQCNYTAPVPDGDGVLGALWSSKFPLRCRAGGEVSAPGARRRVKN